MCRVTSEVKTDNICEYKKNKMRKKVRMSLQFHLRSFGDLNSVLQER